MQALKVAALTLAFLGAITVRAAAQDGTDVDLALVLSADASGSIDEAEFALQREGIASAITDPEVMAAI